jgi:thiol-disulfide isomerase/thioredoxin
VSARDRTPPPAPRFRIKDLSGRTLDLDQLRQGGPVLLDFWATWCKPCHAAVPTLEAWHKQYGAQGLTVIGISVDGPRNYTKVRPFASRMGITYPVAIDQDGRLQQLYQVIAMPTAILVAPNGTIATVRVGYRPGENAALEEKIRALLAPAGKESRGEPAADSTGTDTEKP